MQAWMRMLEWGRFDETRIRKWIAQRERLPPPAIIIERYGGSALNGAVGRHGGLLDQARAEMRRNLKRENPPGIKCQI